MLKQIIIIILIPAFLLQVTGCYSQKEIALHNIEDKELDEIKVVTNNSAEYSFNKSESAGWEIDENNLNIIPRKFKSNRPDVLSTQTDTVKIPITSIKNIYADKFDDIKTGILVSGIFVFILMAAILVGGASLGTMDGFRMNFR